MTTDSIYLYIETPTGSRQIQHEPGIYSSIINKACSTHLLLIIVGSDRLRYVVVRMRNGSFRCRSLLKIVKLNDYFSVNNELSFIMIIITFDSPLSVSHWTACRCPCSNREPSSFANLYAQSKPAVCHYHPLSLSSGVFVAQS